MNDAKEEIRARLSIEDVIGEYVQLKRAGRNFRGLSPFTSEKTPSFFVSPDKNIWHDFSSNKGGDIFSFIMEAEGLDFRGSLEYLARKAGVDLTKYDSASDKRMAQRRKRLYEANHWAMRYFQQCLVRNTAALRYVFEVRKMTKQTVQDFGIGYAPATGDGLVKFLSQKGFTGREIADAGLSNRFGGDLFRGRMTVPLSDTTGRTIGFTARILQTDPNAPKYLNTPQTLIYDKGRHVFALYQAKEAIRKTGFSVIVEGNMDAISSHQVGVKNVVATAGTAMTQYHIKTLGRLSGKVKLSYDGDAAGIKATERAIGLAQSFGVDLEIVSMPEGSKDPDELIQKGVDKWQTAIEQSVPAVDWVIEQYHMREDLATAIGKRNFTTASLRLVNAISDPVMQDYYLKKVAKLADVSPAVLARKLKELTSDDVTSSPRRLKPAKHSTAQQDEYAFEDNILAITLLDRVLRPQLTPEICDKLHDDERKEVGRFLCSHADNISDTPPDLQKYDTYVKILLLKADARYAGWNHDDRASELKRLLDQIDENNLKQKKDQLLLQLQQAEDSGDETTASQLRVELNKIIKES